MKLACILGFLLAATSCAWARGAEKYDGPQYRRYVGGHLGGSGTNKNIGASLAYGGDAGWAWRYDGSFGSAYAGLGAYYLGSNAGRGALNSAGGQLFLNYKAVTAAVLLGAAWLDHVSGITDNPFFGWGGMATLDYPVLGNTLTVGPGGSALVVSAHANTYVNYAGFLALKTWW